MASALMLGACFFNRTAAWRGSFVLNVNDFVFENGDDYPVECRRLVSFCVRH